MNEVSAWWTTTFVAFPATGIMLIWLALRGVRSEHKAEVIRALGDFSRVWWWGRQ